MKQAERDDFLKEIAEFIKDPKGLISRLDERTIFMCNTIEELKEHQEKANGFIQENNDRSIKNTTWIRALKWIIGGIGTALAMGLTHLNGLW